MPGRTARDDSRSICFRGGRLFQQNEQREEQQRQPADHADHRRADGEPVGIGRVEQQQRQALADLDGEIAALESATGAVLYESGGYRVGTDIPAGDYALYENSDAVFASAVVRAGDSEESELVTYHLINGQAVIRLVPDTWLTLSEATAVPISQAEAVSDGFAGEGGYLVGVTLPAGTYTAVPLEKAPLSSYSVYSGILGSSAQLLKFEVLHEATPITLAEGEYIELSGCGLESAFGGEEG